MIELIITVFLGAALGFALRNCKQLRFVNQSITLTIYLMLFLLGVSVGTNEAILKDLLSVGTDALLISIMATLGSVIAAKFVYQRFFKEEVRE